MSSIRAVIAGLTGLTHEDIAERDAAVRDGRCPEPLWPLWPLARQDRTAWAALVDDERIPRFSVYGLFPATHGWVYGDEAANVSIRYDGRTRGRVAIISGICGYATRGIVVKPCQSPSEAEIATIAGDLELGPRQYRSIDGFLTEECVDGQFLTDLNPEDASPERVRVIGERLGTMLSHLHRAGICYNDATVADPDGRSHIIVLPDGDIRLIDFGVALLLRDHPANLTFHDAYNAARTDPMFRLFRQMTSGADPDTLGRFVADYGRRLSRQSAKEIQERDWRIADEGISFIAGTYGPAAADALRAGVSAGRAAAN